MPTPSSDATSAGVERQRDSLFLLARMRLEGDTATHDVRVRNLSAGGMMAEFDAGVVSGTPVVLDMRGVGEVRGRIAWCEAGRIGVAFDRPIDPRAARKPVGGGAKTPLYAKAPPRR